MKKLLLLLLTTWYINAIAEPIFIITSDNVNVREKPITGKVIGKVGKCNSFQGGWYTDVEGWTGIQLPGLDGYISEKFVKEIPEVAFTRAMLGDYMGEQASENTSYSLGTLEEKDGVIVLYITDYTAPDESGFRGHISHVYAGEPDVCGINFTHYLYPYREDIPVKQQMTSGSALNVTYRFTATGDGELRSYDRILTLQESAGIKSKPATERDLFDLKGNVKQMAHARIFVKDESESELQQPASTNEDEENYYDDFDPVLDFVNVMLFSPDGFITEYVALNPEDNSKIKHLTYNSNGNAVSVSAVDDPESFSATYLRSAGDFGLYYKGEGKQQLKYLDDETGKWIKGDINELWIGETIPIQNGEKLTNYYRNSFNPPFISEAKDVDYVSITNNYNPTSDFPSSVIIGYSFGGEGLTIKADVKILETDSHGNWTKRQLISGGKLICAEVREISYY